MINKFQQGGKQDAVMQFIQGLAQTLQADPNQIIQIAQQNPKALEAAVQIYQQTQDMNQAAKAFQQGIQSARRGAKLNYIKSLKHQCADDEELYYYKTGGSIGCGCKKKEDGGKIKDENKKESPVARFKAEKAQKGTKVEGTTKRFMQQEEQRKEAEKKKKEAEEAKRKERERLSEEDYYKGYGYHKQGEDQHKPIKNKKVNSAHGGMCMAVSNFKKAYKQGGSLNGIPFTKLGLM